MFFIRYWYVRAKLALAPNRYTPAEKVALAHQDIDVAKTIILDQSKRVHAGRPDNSLNNNQLVEILQRIHNEDPPLLVDRNAPKFKKSFWGKLNALIPLNIFPSYESFIPEYDANNLEANRKASESLIEMSLLDLKTLAPEYKVKLAKNSDALARKICFGTNGAQNPAYKENLQPSHTAEIYAHYYAPVPTAANGQIEPIANQEIVPTKNFWERLLYDFIKPKINNFSEIFSDTNRKLDAADAAIKLAEPNALNRKQSKKKIAQQDKIYKDTIKEQNKVKANAMREFYAFMDHPDKLAFKSTARLEICLQILKNSPNSVDFFKKNLNDIHLSLDQSPEFKNEFVEFLKSAEAKRPQQGEKLVGSDQREMTSLYNEVLKAFNAQLQAFLNNNPGEAQPTLNKLSFADICDVYKSSQDNIYFDNLLLYIGRHRLAEVLPNLNAFVTLLSVVNDEQLSTFLIDNFNNIDVFKLVSKLNTTLTNEKYENLVKQLVTKMSAAQIDDMLFKNYKDAVILKFLSYARNHIEDNTFNSIVIELFTKYDSSHLLELITTCKDNEQHLRAIKTCFEIVELKTKQPVIDANYPDVAKFFMDNKLAADCLNIQLTSESIVRTGVNASCNNDYQFINKHAVTIIESAAVNPTTATYFNSDDNLAALLKDNVILIDFPIQNINEAQRFFRDIESYKEGGMRSYVVINLELDNENRTKAAKLLSCQPEKLQNALLVFSDDIWKDSFKTRLEGQGITFVNWKEIGAHYTQPSFHESDQFAQIMATPKNIIIPLPNPTHIYSIYKQFPAHALRSMDPFSKAAHEAKRLIDSVMKLGKTIAEKIRKIPGVTELFAINFAPTVAAASSSTPTKVALPAAIPSKKDQAKDSGKKDKKEKDKKLPVNNDALTLKPAAVNTSSHARATTENHTYGLTPPSSSVTSTAKGVGDLLASESSSHQQIAQQQAESLTTSPVESKAYNPQLALDNLQNLAEELSSIEILIPTVQKPALQAEHTATSEQKEKPNVAFAETTSPFVNASAKFSTPKKSLEDSMQKSPAPSPSKNFENNNLQIPENYNLVLTKKWLKEHRKHVNALPVALKHIKKHIILNFDFNAKDQLKELHNFLADNLSENELASFLILNGEHNDLNLATSQNAELLCQLSKYNTGIIGNEYGKTLLNAAKHNIELTSVLLNHEKITTDFKQKTLKEFNIQQQYKLLDLCWSNNQAKELIINHIEQMNRTMKRSIALSAVDSSLAQKLLNQPELARKILREKLVESVLNIGNEFINHNFLQILKLVSANQKDANEFFTKYALTNEDIEKLNPKIDTYYLDLKDNYQTFFNEKNILKQPYSVFKLIFHDSKLAQAAAYLKCSTVQLRKVYFLFPNDESRDQFFKELENADIKINRDFISLELLKNDPNIENQNLVTGEDKLSRHLGNDECSVIVPIPHSNELIALTQFANILKFAGDAKAKLTEKMNSFATSLVKTAQLGSELVVAIFGNKESKIDSIERKRLLLLPDVTQHELMEKAESLGHRNYRSSNSFGRRSPEKPKPLSPPQALTVEERGLRVEDFQEAITGGASAALNILMKQSTFNNIQLLEIITQFSDIDSDDPKIRSEHQLFVSQLKNQKLWTNPAMVDVYTLALGYKNSWLKSAEEKLQKCLELVISCKNPLAFLTKLQLDDLINTYIKTFGDVAADYAVLGLNPRTVTLKGIKTAFIKLSVSEHPDKHPGEEEEYNIKFKKIEPAYRKLLKIEGAKEKLTNKDIILEKDPSLGDWGSFSNGTTQSSLFASSSSSASTSLNSSMSSVVSKGSSSEEHPAATQSNEDKKSSLRPGIHPNNDVD